MNAEKLAKLQAQVRTGGKGTARRKKKVVHKTAATDDKKLQVRTFKFNVSAIITYIYFPTRQVQIILSVFLF